MIHIAKKIVDAVYKVKWISLMGVSGIEAKSIQPTTPYIKIYYHFCWVYLSVRSESTYFMLRSQGIDINPTRLAHLSLVIDFFENTYQLLQKDFTFFKRCLMHAEQFRNVQIVRI